MRPQAAVSCLQQILEENANGLSHIRFIDFIHKSDDFHYRIAVCWTSDSDELRDLLYHQAELIASECGWYPLPQGSRLNREPSQIWFFFLYQSDR